MSDFQSIEASYRQTDMTTSDIPPYDSGIPISGDTKLPGMARIARTDFGKRLVQARKNAKLTQDQLCEKTGIAQSTLSEAENSAVGSKFTAQLAEALGVNPLWLSTGHGPKEVGAKADLFAVPATTPIEDVQLDKSLKPSHLARELGLLFDTLTDRVERARAYSAATQAILDVIQERDAKPTDAQVESAPANQKTPQQ